MIKDPVMISARPRVVETRTQVGHWEGDLLVGNRTTAVVTLVEPKTRFLVMAALPANRTAEALNTAVAAQLGRFPKSLRRPLTWDQGKEIAHHKTLRERVGIDVYLCDPNSPWQRGTNENTNGRLRQYFPKSTDFYQLDQGIYDQVAAELNNRPRRVLQWGNTPPSTASRDCVDTNKGSAPRQANKTVTAKAAGQLHRSARAHTAGHQPPGPCPPAPEPRPGQKPEPSSIPTPSTTLQRQLLHRPTETTDHLLRSPLYHRWGPDVQTFGCCSFRPVAPLLGGVSGPAGSPLAVVR